MKNIVGTVLFFGLTLSSTSFAGRFELVQLGQARADQYLLDTQTGKIWRSVCAHTVLAGCDYSIWEPMDVEGISATIDKIVGKIRSLEKDAKAAGNQVGKEQ